MNKILLASSSPRRQAILKLLGVPFEVFPSRVMEQFYADESPEQTAKRLSLEKADAVSKEQPDTTILAADTVVVLDGKVLGKPSDDQEAYAMLSELQGKWHKVITGVALHTPAGRQSEAATTHVHMRHVARNEILAYIRSGEPYGKAGSYAIQGLGAVLVKEIEGCFYNVVGLPVDLTVQMFRNAGYQVPDYSQTMT